MKDRPGLFDDIPVKPKTDMPKPLPVATGLCDEVDAFRYLAKRFNTGYSCRDCDLHWEEKLERCPNCERTFLEMETRRNQIMRDWKRRRRQERQRGY